MSDLVSSATGELVDIADAEEARQIIAETSVVVAHWNAWSEKVINQMCLCNDRKVWVAAGYGSWEELVEAKNWVWKPRTSGERTAVAEMFRQKGFSLRAIGALLASSPQTVRRDIAGSFDSDVAVPNGTTKNTTQEGAAADSGQPRGDVGMSDDGPIGHDDGAAPDEAAPAFEDDDSDGTPDAVDAVSSPTEEVDADRQPASTPLVSAEGVAGETLPSRSLPVTPSVEDHIAELRADGNWSVEFDKATRQIVAPVRYLAADVIERASAEDLADLDDRVARLNEWLDEVRALRPQGLRVIHGGAS